MRHRLPRPDRSIGSGPVADILLRASVLTSAGLSRLERAAGRCLQQRRDGSADRDRGDVPGWVLVTLMTAGLVTVLWVLARDRLSTVFDRAISSVAGQ
jgi:hypothetical protein